MAQADSTLQVNPLDRAQANQGMEKVPKLIPGSLWNTSAGNFSKALSRKGEKEWKNNNKQTKKRIQASSFPFSKKPKPQDSTVHSDGAVTQDQPG